MRPIKRLRVVLQHFQHLRKLTESLGYLDRHIRDMNIKVSGDMLHDTEEH